VARALKFIRDRFYKKESTEYFDPKGLAEAIARYQKQLALKGDAYVDTVRREHNEREHAEHRTTDRKCPRCGWWTKSFGGYEQSRGGTVDFCVNCNENVRPVIAEDKTPKPPGGVWL
jgi:hypothetical protein